MSSNGAVIDEKVAPVESDVIAPIAERWSPRAFSDDPVEPDKIRQILEAAQWAASSYNEQPWRYIIATKEDLDAYETLLGCLVDFNQQWAQTAPVLMLSFYRKEFSANGNNNRCAPHDVGAASAQLTAQATALDLYVHQMAGIRRDKIRDVYDVPDVFEPMAALAVGYIGDPGQLPDDLAEKEYQSRQRLTLDEIIFSETWEDPADLIQ